LGGTDEHPMSETDATTDTRAIVRRVMSAFNTGDLAVIDELVAADYTNHNAPPGAPQGREGRKGAVAMFRRAFPDLVSTIEDEIAEGDRVVIRVRLRGTNSGEFMGRPPTGRSVDVAGVDIFRVVDGKVTDRWGVLDLQGLHLQLAADPTS
jgi:steroid delta-isomerase-like uncharacterized protein